MSEQEAWDRFAAAALQGLLAAGADEKTENGLDERNGIVPASQLVAERAAIYARRMMDLRAQVQKLLLQEATH